MFKIAKEKQPDKPDDYLVVTEAGTMNGIYDGDTWRNNRGEEITPYACVEYWDSAEHMLDFAEVVNDQRT